MIKLCGFAASNYYNKAKFAMLEKGMDFEEKLVWPSREADFFARTPLGKIPFLETPQGTFTESQAIVEYIESVDTDHPLMPADAYGAAKVRELIQYVEFYLEWEARRLYGEAFFGGKVSDEIKEQTRVRLEKAIAALPALLKPSPFAVGDQLTLADCTLAVHLPVVSMATKMIYGSDFLPDPRIKDYLAMLSARPALQKVNADRKVNVALMAQRSQA